MDLTCGPIYIRLLGPWGRLESNAWALIFIGSPTNIAPYIHRLTDEYIRVLLFLLLPVLAASLDGDTPKQEEYT
jgi:hypothetical protein